MWLLLQKATLKNIKIYTTTGWVNFLAPPHVVFPAIADLWSFLFNLSNLVCTTELETTTAETIIGSQKFFLLN